MPADYTRTVFFISDGTGITAETLGHSLLTQFEDLRFRQIRIPFVSTLAQALECQQQISRATATDGIRPIVVSTLVDANIGKVLRETDALFLDFFEAFIVPLENELGSKSSHTIGRSHGQPLSQDYANRIDAVNFTLAHDDGASDIGLDKADVILIGVSRCGKTPTSLYLALQFGVRAANYPLIPEDFERSRLPGAIERLRVELDHRAGQRHAGLRGDTREQGLVETLALRAQLEVGLAVDLAHRGAELAERRFVDEVHREGQRHAQGHRQHRHGVAQRLVQQPGPGDLAQQGGQRGGRRCARRGGVHRADCGARAASRRCTVCTSTAGLKGLTR